MIALTTKSQTYENVTTILHNWCKGDNYCYLSVPKLSVTYMLSRFIQIQIQIQARQYHHAFSNTIGKINAHIKVRLRIYMLKNVHTKKFHK